MSETRIRLPPFGHATGTVRWAKKVGDRVSKGEHLLDVDFKTSVERFPAPCNGVLQSITVQDGTDVHGEKVLGLIAADAEKAKPPAEQWVSIECTFKCRSCGFVVPLNHIDVDGAVVCARCSLEQAFEVRGWEEALAFAHGVADGALGDTEKRKVIAKHKVANENALEIKASLGHPLCEKCHALLVIEVGDHGKATAKCAACETSVTYEVPAAALKMTNGALRVVIAAGHRTDHLDVRVSETSGVIAVHCPSCGAPIELPAGSAKIVTCKFCSATSRIPDGLGFRMGGAAPVPQPMWLEFTGASAAREEAATKAEKKHNEKLFRRFHDAAKVSLAQSRGRHDKEQTNRHKLEAAKEAAAEKKSAQGGATKPAANRTSLVIVLLLIVIAASAFLAWKFLFAES